MVIGTEYLLPIRYWHKSFIDEVWNRVMLEVFNITNYEPIDENLLRSRYGVLCSSDKYSDGLDLFYDITGSVGIKNISPENMSKCAGIMKAVLEDMSFMTSNLKRITSELDRSKYTLLLVGNCTLRERDMLMEKFPELCENSLFSCEHGCDVSNPECMAEYLGNKFKGEKVCHITSYLAKRNIRALDIIDCTKAIPNIADTQDAIANSILRMGK